MGWVSVDQETFNKYLKNNSLTKMERKPLSHNTLYLTERGDQVKAFEFIASDSKVYYKVWEDEFDLEKLRNLASIQAQDGNYDYSEYMYGMHVGSELMLATAEGRDPVYRSKPEVWRETKGGSK